MHFVVRRNQAMGLYITRLAGTGILDPTQARFINMNQRSLKAYMPMDTAP